MADSRPVVEHYGRGTPIERIRSQLVAQGHDLASLSTTELAGVDEFHLGGGAATQALLESIEVDAGSRVLDIGCGIGGAARAISTATGCAVVGVDLTPSFVETAGDLSELVGLSERTRFEVADATALPFDDAEFDAVTMLHVGMNIADKFELFSEMARVVRSGGSVHVYDIMRVGAGDIVFPVPWSTSPTSSFLANPQDYLEAMASVGLEPRPPVDRRGLVRAAIEHVREHPPSVDLSHLMGPEWPTMFANLVAALEHGVLAPFEIVARRQRDASETE